MSGLDGREKGWDESTMEGAGEARFGRLGRIGKIDQYIKLYYISANLENKIKSFDPSIDHPIAEVLPGGFCLNRKICAAGPGERLPHGCVLF
jgi:hypothetical protein